MSCMHLPSAAVGSLGRTWTSRGPLLCTLSSIMYRHWMGSGAADWMYLLVPALSELRTIFRYGCTTTCNEQAAASDGLPSQTSVAAMPAD